MQPSHDASHDHHQHPTKKQRTLLDYFSLQQNTGPTSQTQSTEQETLMQNTPAQSNEQAPAGEQSGPILGRTREGAVLPTEPPTTLIIQPNTTVNSFARSRHRAQQRWCALLQRIFKYCVGNRLTSSQWDDFTHTQSSDLLSVG